MEPKKKQQPKQEVKTVYQLHELLKLNFKSDRTPVQCVEAGTLYNLDFTENKVYKIYLSSGRPRIYTDDSSEMHLEQAENAYREIDDDETMPAFRVNPNQLADGPTDILNAFNNNPATTAGRNEETKAMKRVLNRLNGISLAEEGIVEQRQATSVKHPVNIDLVALLESSPMIKELSLGKKSLLEGIDVDMNNGTLKLNVSQGEVVKEENSAVAKALHSLVSKQTSTVNG